MEMRRHPGDPPGQNLATFGHEFFEQIRVFVIDRFGSNIDATAWHNPVRPSKIRSALGIFRFHYLFHLPMKSATPKKRVIFLLLQAAWRIRAFFVTRRDVTGDRLAFCSCFCAFERNDVPWHDGYSFESVMVSSSSPSPPSSSVKPKREVTGCRTRKAFFCFSI